jgi:hypothetical protein
MCQDQCPILNLFFDWNPIYADDYNHELGTSNNQLYQRKTPEELNLFAKL